MNLVKRQPIRSEAYTKAADGESCTICDSKDGTVVFVHLDEAWAGKGFGQKGDDVAGFDGCMKCHNAYANHHVTIEDWEITRAVYRTLLRRILKGIVIIK
jgi:hypothetical protein